MHVLIGDQRDRRIPGGGVAIRQLKDIIEGAYMGSLTSIWVLKISTAQGLDSSSFRSLHAAQG